MRGTHEVSKIVFTEISLFMLASGDNRQFKTARP